MFEGNIFGYAAAALIMLTPGPSSILIITRSTSSTRAGLAIVGGMLMANLILLAVAILGISSVVVAYQPALMALKWVGAGYLALLGIKLIRDARAPLETSQSVAKHGSAGFLTAITNPKALVFYMAFLPQFVVGDHGVQRQLIGLGIVDMLLAALVFGMFALAGSILSPVFHREIFRVWLNRGTGAVMIGAAALVSNIKLPAHP